MSLDLTLKDSENNFRMGKPSNNTVYEFEKFRLDAVHLMLYRENAEIPLGPKAVEMVLALIERRGEIVSKDELMNVVWTDSSVEESNLSQYLHVLRKTLGDTQDHKPFIETLRRRGYRFNGDVAVSEDANGHLPQRRGDAEEIKDPFLDGGGETVNQAQLQLRVQRRDNVVALADWLDDPAPYPFEPLAEMARPKQGRFGLRTAAIVATVTAGAAIFLAVFLLTGNNLRFEKDLVSMPFGEMTLSRLTTSGRTTHAAISSDGKYVAHSIADAEGDSLWVRRVDAPTGVRVAGPAPSEFVWVSFAPEGDSVYYVALDKDKGDTALLRVPVLGGPASMVGYDVGPIGFSPDGKQITYVRSDQDVTRLFVANADAGGERSIGLRQQPEYFWGYWNAPAWSPDGKTIAAQVRLSDERGQYETILGVNVEDGSQTPLTSARWNYAGQPVWLAGGEGLLVTASERAGSPVQIWHIERTSGLATRVTNDLNDYHDLSLTSDSSRLVAVQDHSVSSIWVAPVDESSRARQIATETGLVTDMAWTPDGRIIYRSNAGGGGDIWVVNADGSGSRQLTIGARATRGLAVSRDGRFIFFGSDRGGRYNIWRIDADGSGSKQLTYTSDNFYPYPTPDGTWVVFQREVLESRLWKVPTDGGEPVPLSDTRAVRPVVSADGKMIAYTYLEPGLEGSRWSIGVMSAEGGSRIKRFDLPATVMPSERVVRWSADGGIAFPNSPGGGSDIWLQPLNGRPARQLTNFKGEQIVAFDWSVDGSSLAIARGAITSDVVLINNSVSK
jgi:Tol biopolymer transport system component/DNA-binding winged helix-turn-helix (wHTH) protein